MIAYHGSDSNFKTFRLSKSLVKHNSTLENEGLGIYFSTDIEVAKSYGKYVYTIEINGKYLSDFRKQSVCTSYLSKVIKEVYDKTGLNISLYVNMDIIGMYMLSGGIAISKIGKELQLNLDSNFDWYQLPKSKIETVYRLLRAVDKNCPKAYLFTYHIKNIGVIKDVSEDVVKIVRKEQRCLV